MLGYVMGDYDLDGTYFVVVWLWFGQKEVGVFVDNFCQDGGHGGCLFLRLRGGDFLKWYCLSSVAWGFVELDCVMFFVSVDELVVVGFFVVQQDACLIYGGFVCCGWVVRVFLCDFLMVVLMFFVGSLGFQEVEVSDDVSGFFGVNIGVELEQLFEFGFVLDDCVQVVVVVGCLGIEVVRECGEECEYWLVYEDIFDVCDQQWLV